MGIPIPGMTRESLDKTSTEAKLPRRDFPVVLNRYSTFTAEVEKVEIKIIGDDEKLAIYARNGECLAEILINLDIRKTNPESKKTADEQMQLNLQTLTKAVKVLGIYNQQGEIEKSLFGQAKGRLITFAGKQTGNRFWEGKTYPKTSFVFNGAAEALVHVEPWTGDAAAPVSAPTGTAQGLGGFDDIPF